jgi:hypothetical protein
LRQLLIVGTAEELVQKRWPEGGGEPRWRSRVKGVPLYRARRLQRTISKSATRLAGRDAVDRDDPGTS